jgi:hypothetical protein
MRYTNVKTFHKDFFKEVENLPVTITRYGKPYFIVESVEGEKEVKIPQEPKVEFVGEPIIEEVLEEVTSPPEELKSLGTCSWDKTFKCTSPAVIKLNGKAYCGQHAERI